MKRYETKLNFFVEKFSKAKLLDDQIEESQISNQTEKFPHQISIIKKRNQELRTYQQHLLPEGISSCEKVLEVYEMDRNRRKFEPAKVYSELHKSKELI